MNNTKATAVVAALAALMAITRFHHFGSAFSLPDASLAIFFLGGLYTARLARASAAAFVLLTLEAGLVDYCAISVQGISGYCVTPAYWTLIPAYGSLWLAGRWFSHRHTIEGKGLAALGVTAWAASSFAFVLSNVTFYLYSGYFAGMGVAEYAFRVSQYYGSYVAAALLYVACAAGAQMLFGAVRHAHARSHVA